jgi:predicted ArsR family transcriptional regulator
LKDLAKECGVGAFTIGRHVSSLAKKNKIIIETTYRADGGRGPNRYYPSYDPDSEDLF